MGSKKIAIQTQLWGNDNLERDFRPIFDEARQAGYDGVECRFTVLRQKERLAEYLQAHPFELLAVHAAPVAFRADGEWKPEADGTVGAMQELGVRYLLLSGMQPGRWEDAFAVADRFAEAGIETLYHNHAYEFEHGYRLFDELLEHPRLGLALDIGWLFRAGVPLAGFLERYGSRVRYFHVKDTTAERWKELGAGEAGIEAAVRAMETAAADWWTVEQDDTERTAYESASISRRYLAGLGY